MFSWIEQRTIKEKVEELKKIKEGNLSSIELAESITGRRMRWIKANLERMRDKYCNLPLEEQAWRIIYFEHMKINPKDSIMTRLSPKKIRIDSYNFCPYLEASKQLDLDTKFVCKKILEPSIQKMCGVINPKLKFSRNYNNIRPKNHHFCEEYIELVP